MLSKSHTKYITSLHHKKFRDEFGVFIAEGPKVIAELLQEITTQPKAIYATKNWLETNETNSIETILVEPFELEKISALHTPNQVLAVFKQPVISTPNLTKKVALALDGIQDPGNLGTIIRTADWFGIDTIICSMDCADMYNPKVVQSTMGSIARVHVYYTELAPFLSKNKIVTYAAALNGEDVSIINNLKEGIIIIGNESKGISSAVLQSVTHTITIAKKGNAESLNAAVAAGIVLSRI